MSVTLARRLARVTAALAVATSAGSAQVTAGPGSANCAPPGCTVGDTARDRPGHAASAFAAPTTFTTTPEPATLALIALGVLSMAGAERARRRARS